LVPTIVVAIGTALGVGFYEVVSFLLGQFDVTVSYGVKVALLTALYNAVLTPIVSPLIRRIIEGSKPRRVVRL
jgi:Mg/Co/Ni transporter MgtE